MAERVWEKILTEQDKATLVGKGERLNFVSAVFAYREDGEFTFLPA